MNRLSTAISARIFLALAVAITAVSSLSPAARADNEFVTTDTTVAGTVVDRNYLVGKNAGLVTQPGSVTLQVNGDVFPDFVNALFGPNGLMTGINVFGTHKATIAGSTQMFFGHDSSVNTVAGGFVQNCVGLGNSSYTVNGGTSNNTYGGGSSAATLNSGQITSWTSADNAQLNVTGGTVTTAVLNGTSTLNVSAGAITNLQVNPGSVANVSGTGTIGTRTGSGNVNYNAVTVPASFELLGATTSTLNNVALQTLKVDQTATVTVNNAR